jgi:hypothetical protein
LVLRQVCTKFSNGSLPSSYKVTSGVSTKVFELFLSSLKGEKIKVTKLNFPGISSLCNEFGFKLENSSYRLGQVETAIEQLKIDIKNLSGEISRLFENVSMLKCWTPAPNSVIFSALHFERTDSRIISDFPEIFTEFRKKQFKILWRGSRDGFKAKDFHDRCNGHSNTLTVILDTNGNIFGGFTPLEWETPSPECCIPECDSSRKSFLFTLKNPHNIPARRFVLNDGMEYFALGCGSRCGPDFIDICVLDDCNVKTDNFTELGGFYVNDSGLDGKKVFTGSPEFQVKEIEVFEIAE